MAAKTYSMSEVEKHNNPEDAWMVIHNKVYNVSNWKHPGGSSNFEHFFSLIETPMWFS